MPPSSVSTSKSSISEVTEGVINKFYEANDKGYDGALFNLLAFRSEDGIGRRENTR